MVRLEEIPEIARREIDSGPFNYRLADDGVVARLDNRLVLKQVVIHTRLRLYIVHFGAVLRISNESAAARPRHGSH